MQTLDRQVDYWNGVGLTKPFGHPVNFKRLTQWLTPDSRILEFGCGYGRVLGMLREHGYRNLVGVDPAAEMVATARRRLRDVDVQVLGTLPHNTIEPASVDAAFLLAVLTCNPTDEGQRVVLGEIERVLRPGGLLYISDLWLQEDERNVARYVRDQPKYGTYGVFDLPDGATVRHQTRAWVDELTRAYRRVAVDEMTVGTMNGHQAQGFQWFGLKLG